MSGHSQGSPGSGQSADAKSAQRSAHPPTAKLLEIRERAHYLSMQHFPSLDS